MPSNNNLRNIARALNEGILERGQVAVASGFTVQTPPQDPTVMHELRGRVYVPARASREQFTDQGTNPFPGSLEDYHESTINSFVCALKDADAIEIEALMHILYTLTDLSRTYADFQKHCSDVREAIRNKKLDKSKLAQTIRKMKTEEIGPNFSIIQLLDEIYPVVRNNKFPGKLHISFSVTTAE